jgi:aspartyl protease family protein
MKVDPNDRPDRLERGPDRSKTKSPVKLLFIGIALLAACSVIGGIIVFQRQSLMQIPVDALREFDDEGQRLESKWRRDPCNRSVAGDLAAQFLKHQEFLLVVKLYSFEQRKCSAVDEIEPMLFSAQMGLSNYKEAAATADDLVRQFPADPTAYGWRAEAKEKVGDVIGAYEDMRKALDRFPDRSNVHISVFYDTARLAAASGHPCDAMIIIRDYIAMDYVDHRSQQLETLMNEWREAGRCAEINGYGESIVKYDEQAGEYIVQVDINGNPARMIVDTGATLTMLTAKFARLAGVSIDRDNPISITTANGSVSVTAGRADKVALGRSTLENVSVLVQPDDAAPFGDNIDGLLGLSFMGNFQIQLTAGIMKIRPRD